jgi:hypothetical protein
MNELSPPAQNPGNDQMSPEHAVNKMTLGLENPAFTQATQVVATEQPLNTSNPTSNDKDQNSSEHKRLVKICLNFLKYDTPLPPKYLTNKIRQVQINFVTIFLLGIVSILVISNFISFSTGILTVIPLELSNMIYRISIIVKG